MLTEDRKRRRCGGDNDTGQLAPQAKRKTRAQPLSPEPGRDACDSKGSNGESGSAGSPGHAAECFASPCAVAPGSPPNPGVSDEAGDPPKSYLQINRILKEAHLHSLQSRGQVHNDLLCL